MTKQVQIRRGTTTQHNSFTGAIAELSYDTDKKTIIAHDGSTVGGIELARKDFANLRKAEFPETLKVGFNTDPNYITGLTGSLNVAGVTTFAGIVTTGMSSTSSMSEWDVKIGHGNTAFIVNGNQFISGISTVETTRGRTATFNNLTITGFGATTFELNTVVTQASGAGVTAVAIGNSSGVAIGDFVSIGTYFSNVEVLGIGQSTVEISFNGVLSSTTISTPVAVGATLIAVVSTAGVSIGNSFSISGIGTNVPITGIGTVALAIVDTDLTSTTVTAVVSAGATIIGVAGTSGVSIGSSLSTVDVENARDGVITNVPIVGFTTVTAPAYNSTFISTITTNNVSIGDTIIPFTPTTGVSIGNSISLGDFSGNYLTDRPIVGVSTDSVTISGAGVTALVTGGALVGISTIRTDSAAVILASSVGSGLTIGQGILYSQPTFPVSPAFQIGAGSTFSVGLSSGTTVSISTITTTAPSILVGYSSVSEYTIPINTVVNIQRIVNDTSVISIQNINTKNLNVTGIASINGLKYPLVDGIDGQVLQTDGQGNIGFGTGGGGSGSRVIVRVSQATGSDDNDGRTKPVASIKKAAQIASFLGFFFNTGATIVVESGDYIEDNPIILYDNVNIIADSLRNVVLRPLNAGVDFLKVRNGNYITGLTFTDFIDQNTKDPQHTFGYTISFDEPFNAALNRVGYACTNDVNIIGAIYNEITGVTSITAAAAHELYPGNTVRLSGIGWTCGYDETGISSFRYNNAAGIGTITLRSSPARTLNGGSYTIGEKLFLHNLPFGCSAGYAGVTTTIFPDGTAPTKYAFTITGINTSSKTITLDIGISTISHEYVGYPKLGISTLTYTNTTGVTTFTTKENHGYNVNDKITFRNLPFSCGGAYIGVTTTIFPDGDINQYNIDGYTYTVTGVTTNSVTYNSGISTIGHNYDGYGSVGINTFKYTASSGVSTCETTSAHGVSQGDYITLDGLNFLCSGYTPNSIVNITNLTYDETTGITTITTDAGHGALAGEKVKLANITLTCDASHLGVTTTLYPHPGAGASPNAVYSYDVFNVTSVLSDTQFTINSGVSTIPHTYVSGGTAKAGITTTVFPDGTSPYGQTFLITSVVDATTFTFNAGISTITHEYINGGTINKVGTAEKVPTIQKIQYYPELNSSGIRDFGVVSAASTTVFTIRAPKQPNIPHYYVEGIGGVAVLSKPQIFKSPYIQNCTILSSLGGNGILVDGDKVITPNVPAVQLLAENPSEGAIPEFGKSMVANAFTMISFDGIGWRVINDGYSQVVSCFQIFCRYGSLAQSGGYLSITNSATNFGDIALRATGFSPNPFSFDRGRVAATGTSGGLQTLRVVGLGRSDQDLYVIRFVDNLGVDKTSLFKPVVTEVTVNPAVGVNTTTDIITIGGHPFVDGDSVVYLGNEQVEPPITINGLVSGNTYYVQYIDSGTFKLFEDDSYRKAVDLRSAPAGINTFQKNNQEFVVNEIIDSHTSYQTLTLAGAGATAQFNAGQQITQSVAGGTATGFAVTFFNSTRELLVSVEEVGGTRRFFATSGGNIVDHGAGAAQIAVGVTAVVGVSTFTTVEFKVDSTSAGNVIQGIGNLPGVYKCNLHRPSIVNSSSHTWEFSGAGVDYNALPQNGGKGLPASEQVSEQGGRVYASGTNELGDFKIGKQITAFNRTGNIVFNNKVSIGELDSIRLSLSGGVAVEEFSTDTNLGEAEQGGPLNKRVATQLAVRSFMSNRLGTFIDKTVSQNAIPNAVVQLNSSGQINGDLIPPKIVNYTRTTVGTGRTVLCNSIPASNILNGDTVVEPELSYVLIQDVVSQYLILDDDTRDYDFPQDSQVVSALAQAAIGVVTTPPPGVGIGTSIVNYTGYGNTGLVKGVLLGTVIQNGGSGYTNPGLYTCFLQSTTGIGTSSLAEVTVGGSGTVTNVRIKTGGRYYASGNVLTAIDSTVGGRSGGGAFTVTVNDVETRLYLSLTNQQKFAGSSALADYIADGTAVGINTTLNLDVSYEFNPTTIETGGAVDFPNDRIVVGAGHTLHDGDIVKYTTNGGTNITGVIEDVSYYVKKVGVSSVELHSTYAISSRQDLSGSGIGTHNLIRCGVSTIKDTITFVNHGFTVGDPVRITGSTPVGIDTNSFYYLGSITQNGFTFHTTQADALSSVLGVTFNSVGIAETSSGTMTFTKQNVRYASTVNTSSRDPNNWSLLASADIDAANIISGQVNPSRLGSGNANSDTVLGGNSAYRKAVFSVGIGSTQPFGITASSSDYGVGFATHYGNISLTATRVASTLDLYSTTGVAKFKNSTFAVDEDGAVSLKNSATGDVDASTLGTNNGAFYLNSANHTGTIPLARGGTGQTGVPGNGAILIGNGSAYNLTSTPTFQSTVTFNGNVDIANATSGTGLELRGSSPTINLRDTDNRGAYIHVNGNTFHILRATGTDAGRGSWATVGGYWPLEINLENNNATFGGTVTMQSDIRSKKNVETITDALQRVLSMRGVFYERIHEDETTESKRECGVIAQEVQEVLPEVVHEGQGEDPRLSVSYGNIVGILIEAIKEQQKQIEDLKTSIDELKSQLGN
jgi:hypothetical protein